ncbi:MAG: diguanylate cyclase domain-containing protein [Thalassobaculum sp.]
MTGLTLASLYDTVHTLERVLDALPVLIIATDSAGRIVMTSRRTRDALGLPEVDLLDKPVAAVVPGLTVSVSAASGDDEPTVDIGPSRRRALRRDATAFPVEIQATAHRLGDDVICLLALLDVTQRLQTDHAMRESRALLDAILAGLPAMVGAKTPDGTYEFINAYQADVFGITPEEAVGRTATDLLGAEAGRQIDGADRRLASGVAIAHFGPEKLIDADGRARTFMVTRSAMRDAKGQIQRVLTVGIDVTHATAAEERVERLSLLDDMTGLPNRGALQQILGAQLRGAKRDQRRIGLVLIRLANLSDIADGFGTLVRDGVVRQLAIRLGGLVSESAVLSRFDETTFALLVPDPKDAGDLEQETVRLVARAGRPVTAAGSTVTVKCRAGIALYPDTALDADSLLQAAEHELRMRRRMPAAAVPRASSDAEAYFDARRKAAQALRLDFEHDRLQLRLLPIRSLDGHALTGFRTCLLDSLDRPLLGLSAPDTATGAPLTAAVEGLASDLCERMLRDACQWAGAWSGSPRVTVPLSADILLQPDLVDMIRDLLRDAGLPANRLRLAIDETALADDPELMADVLESLADLGPDLCLTGFGAGGNPMLSLARQPFRHVTLDMASLGALDEGVAATVAFARALGRSVGADGVRTADHLAFLRDCGCTEACGPALGGPLVPVDARALDAPPGSAKKADRVKKPNPALNSA